jgi:hypothetical protein
LLILAGSAAAWLLFVTGDRPPAALPATDPETRLVELWTTVCEDLMDTVPPAALLNRTEAPKILRQRIAECQISPEEFRRAAAFVLNRCGQREGPGTQDLAELLLDEIALPDVDLPALANEPESGDDTVEHALNICWDLLHRLPARPAQEQNDAE